MGEYLTHRARDGERVRVADCSGSRDESIVRRDFVDGFKGVELWLRLQLVHCKRDVAPTTRCC